MTEKKTDQKHTNKNKATFLLHMHMCNGMGQHRSELVILHVDQLRQKEIHFVSQKVSRVIIELVRTS
jgi:hypothetical protein